MPSCKREARVKRVLKVLDEHAVVAHRADDQPPLTQRELAAALVDAAGMPEVMGAKETGAALGVRAENLRSVAGMPEAEQHVSNNRLWQADIVRRFAATRRRAATRQMEEPDGGTP